MAVFPFNSDAPKNQWSEIQRRRLPRAGARLRL